MSNTNMYDSLFIFQISNDLRTKLRDKVQIAKGLQGN